MAETRRTFPETGTAWPELQRDMRARKSGDVDWQHGRVPLYVFRNDQSTYEVGRDAFMEFFTENALGRARAFHSLASMEREVLDFGLDLFHAPDSGAGTFTSGGSESIFLAMKAARDEYRARTGATRADALNIVAASTLHPAFDKAAAAMDIEIRRGGLRPDMRADPAALRALIDARTMALVGSAPCFPHGVIDPIGALSELALDAGIWLHVDACVGGWMAPFFTSAGRPTPDFDFRFAGVRSISADLHKFGFCPKPASTVFYRDAADLERATFRIDDWPNGTFVTQTLVGTRPGGAVAGAWAVLNHLGRAGYEDAARRLGAMTDAYCQGIAAIPGLYMIARPDLSIINFGARDLDIFAVSEAMARRGWLPGLTRTPKGMHAMMSLLHEPAREDYLAHLREAVAEVRAAPEARATISARY
jgi:glutamate/tyrosine decarboxylase-like PLP-dependent enzyme